MMPSTVDTKVGHRGVVASHAAVALERPKALDRTILRHPSRAGLEVLTHLATNGCRTYAQLVRHISESRHVPGRSLEDLGPLDPKWLARLGRTLALMDADPRDRPDAFYVLCHLVDTRGAAALGLDTLWIYAQLALLHGNGDRARAVLTGGQLRGPLQAALSADLANPYGPVAGADDPGEWLERLSELFLLPDGERLVLREVDDDAPPFDRIDVVGSRPVAGGPLVTVVLPVYRPGPDLLTAVRSVVSQTWRELECLIVDDASPRGHEEWFERVRDMDDRVRIVRLSENGGTYAARNAGIDAAAGDYVTFQDADDWSHPRRVELQVQALLGDSALQATWSRCVRVDDRMLVSELRQAVIRHNESSLCFRRADVLDRVGYFDTLRKGADSEYRHRIDAAFDGAVELLSGVPPLAMIRRTAGSLSRAEFRGGWRHRARFAYRAAYDRWHGRIRAGSSHPYVPHGERPAELPAPVRMLHTAGDRPGLDLDVVVCGDWRDGVGNDHVHAAACGEVRALAAAGLEVGVAHVQPLWAMSPTDHYLGETFYSLLEAGLAREVLLDDPADVGVVSLHEPAWLQFPPLERPAWQVGAVRIVAGDDPLDVVNDRIRYLVGECSETARSLFGVEPVWVPRTSRIAATIELAGEVGVRLADAPYRIAYPCADPVESGDPVRGEGAAVVGRWSRDEARAFPTDGATLRSVYGVGAGTPVIVGGTTTVRALLGGAPPKSWTVMASGALRFEELLGRVDVVVHLDDPRADEDLEWMVLLAVERGVPVVLSYRYHERFGPLAAYATASDVAEVVAALGPGAPSRFEHVACARRVAQERWDPVELVATMRRLLGQDTQTGPTATTPT